MFWQTVKAVVVVVGTVVAVSVVFTVGVFYVAW